MPPAYILVYTKYRFLVSVQKVKSLSDLIKTIDEYIYWYNHHRIKLTLGGYSPIQFRLMKQQMI